MEPKRQIEIDEAASRGLYANLAVITHDEGLFGPLRSGEDPGRPAESYQ